MKPENPVESAILDNGIGMYAICSDARISFQYWIARLYQGGEIPDGLDVISFPTGRWAVFTTKGPIPESLQAMNTEIFQNWLPNEGAKVHADAHSTIEVYSKGDPRSPEFECSIWVPVSSDNN